MILHIVVRYIQELFKNIHVSSERDNVFHWTMTAQSSIRIKDILICISVWDLVAEVEVEVVKIREVLGRMNIEW